MASILVVDDDHDGAQLIGRWLEHDGHDVAIVRTGEEALALATELRSDAVLLDMMLPGLRGDEVARRLAAMDPAPPIVVVSIRDQDEFEDVPATAWVGKPFTRHQLLGAVSAALAGGRHG